MTWVYLSRAARWEEALPPGVHAAAFGADGAGDGGGLPMFASFPNYDTGRLTLRSREVNLLAALTSWVVTENAEQFLPLADA